MYKTTNNLFNRLKNQKREEILNYILYEFGTFGYEAASIRRIATNTNLSVGSLYQYFSNKKGMLKVAIEYLFYTLNEYIYKINCSPLILENRLAIMFDVIIEVANKHPQLIIFYNKIPSDKAMTYEWIKQFYIHNSFFQSYWKSVNDLQKNQKIENNIDIVVFTFIIDTIMLSGELLQSTQYQKIKTNVFIGGCFSTLKKQVIENLTILIKES